MEPAVESVLKKLESLSPPDRRWMIENLPSSARAALLSGRATTDRPVPAEVVTSEPAPLSAYAPATVAQVLAGEAGWIIEAVLRDTEAQWRKQVWRHLPAVVRSAAVAAKPTSARISKNVVESLHRALREKLDALGVTNIPAVERPSWQRWLSLRGWRRA